MSEKLPKKENPVADIAEEARTHLTSEEMAYSLFRLKQVYDGSDDARKALMSPLFLKTKSKLQELIRVDIGRTKKNDLVRLAELDELSKKVAEMNI